MVAVSMGAQLPQPCQPWAQTLPRAAATATGLPGSPSTRDLRKQPAVTGGAGQGRAASPCAVWALPAPALLAAAPRQGALGMNHCCSGGGLGHEAAAPTPPGLGHRLRGLLSHTLYFNTGCAPKPGLCAAEGPLSIRDAARPAQGFGFGPGHQQGAL